VSTIKSPSSKPEGHTGGAPNAGGTNKGWVDESLGGFVNKSVTTYACNASGVPTVGGTYTAIQFTGNVWWNVGAYPAGATYFQIAYFFTYSDSGGTVVNYMEGSQNFRN
jgi:hypothetical protein